MELLIKNAQQLHDMNLTLDDSYEYGDFIVYVAKSQADLGYEIKEDDCLFAYFENGNDTDFLKLDVIRWLFIRSDNTKFEYTYSLKERKTIMMSILSYEIERVDVFYKEAHQNFETTSYVPQDIDSIVVEIAGGNIFIRNKKRFANKDIKLIVNRLFSLLKK
ncbi:hypothetical protein [Macrococcus brunensis]|uniref:hypothetical protein n=1 Tax=Macrococcus brunensis TaxID=198483 RepID=UPI001EF02D50|nr:hypothetical protein [Macrococcus brunensis]ULG71161.1 hypothetical protein MGG12_07350 [Macrococcus brunensis]